jgi:mono/diheme cytochrome c family protein
VWVGERLGVSAQGWALTLEPDALDLDDGDLGLDDLLLSGLFADLARDRPELEHLQRSVLVGGYAQAHGAGSRAGADLRYGSETSRYLRLGGALDLPLARQACGLLSAKPLPVALGPAGQPDGAAVLASACAGCHQGDARGPKLPFADAAALHRALSSGSTLGSAVLARLRSRGADRMPPDRALSSAELEAVRRLVEGR